MPSKIWYAVSGESVKGPFYQLQHAKQALGIEPNVRNDQVVISGELYRYGSKFVGTSHALHMMNIAHRGCHHVESNAITHIAIVRGREVHGRIQTIHTGPWQPI